MDGWSTRVRGYSEDACSTHVCVCYGSVTIPKRGNVYLLLEDVFFQILLLLVKQKRKVQVHSDDVTLTAACMHDWWW